MSVVSVSSFKSFIGDWVAPRLEFLIHITSLTSSTACPASQPFSVLQHSGASPASSFLLTREDPMCMKDTVFTHLSPDDNSGSSIFSTFVINTVVINMHFVGHIFNYSMMYAYVYILHIHPFSMKFLSNIVTPFNSLKRHLTVVGISCIIYFTAPPAMFQCSKFSTAALTLSSIFFLYLHYSRPTEC